MRRWIQDLKSIIRPDYVTLPISKTLKIHRSARIYHQSRIKLGDYIYIGPNCILNAEGGITLGDGTIFSSEVVILSSTHDYNDGEQLPFDIFDNHRPISIGRGVWLGYRSMVCPGVTVGDGAVIGMGAVVTRDVQPGIVVGGNPAVKIGARDEVKLCHLLSKDAFFLKEYNHQRRPRVVRPS